MWDPYAEVVSDTLPNGLDIHVVQWDRPWVKVGVAVFFGAKDDPEGREGRAHFLEHLLSENTTEGPGGIQEFFEARGGYASLGTTNHLGTQFRFALLKQGDDLPRGLEIMGRMIMNPSPLNGLEEERNTIISEFFGSFPTPLQYQLKARQMEALFSGTRLGRFTGTLGSEASIRAMTASDIEAACREGYRPANMALVAVGGIEPQRFREIVLESPFAIPRGGNRITPPSALTAIAAPTIRRQEVSISTYSKTRPEYARLQRSTAVPGVVSQLAVVVAENVTYRHLFRELRMKRRRTYDISVWNHYHPEAYEFCFRFEFPWDAAALVETVLEEALERASEDTEGIKRETTNLLRRKEAADPNGTSLLTACLDDLLERQRIITLSEEIGNLQRLNPEEVQEVIRRTLSDTSYTEVTVP